MPVALCPGNDRGLGQAPADGAAEGIRDVTRTAGPVRPQP
jgi:hypothetical protein